MLLPLSNDPTTQHGEAAAAGGHTPLSSSSMTRTYSTSWVPLEGTIQYWLDVGRETALVTALAAAGHALFALSHEKHALHCYTQGWHNSWLTAHGPAQDAFQQTEQHLSAAAHHWTHATHLLDALAAQQQQEAVPADEPGRIRALSQVAREQRERLYQLAEEVRADLAVAPQQAAGGIAAPRSPRPQQEEGMTWPND